MWPFLLKECHWKSYKDRKTLAIPSSTATCNWVQSQSWQHCIRCPCPWPQGSFSRERHQTHWYHMVWLQRLCFPSLCQSKRLRRLGAFNSCSCWQHCGIPSGSQGWSWRQRRLPHGWTCKTNHENRGDRY